MHNTLRKAGTTRQKRGRYGITMPPILTRRSRWPVSDQPLDPATVAARLQSAMAAQHLTLSALAAQSGVAPLVIRELLRGKEQPRNPLTLVKLALALNQPWDWL